ncbi:hypothetical protein [Maribacter sp. 2307ULW6-5]
MKTKILKKKAFARKNMNLFDGPSFELMLLKNRRWKHRDYGPEAQTSPLP